MYINSDMIVAQTSILLSLRPTQNIFKFEIKCISTPAYIMHAAL